MASAIDYMNGVVQAIKSGDLLDYTPGEIDDVSNEVIDAFQELNQADQKSHFSYCNKILNKLDQLRSNKETNLEAHLTENRAESLVVSLTYNSKKPSTVPESKVIIQEGSKVEYSNETENDLAKLLGSYNSDEMEADRTYAAKEVPKPISEIPPSLEDVDDVVYSISVLSEQYDSEWDNTFTERDLAMNSDYEALKKSREMPPPRFEDSDDVAHSIAALSEQYGSEWDDTLTENDLAMNSDYEALKKSRDEEYIELRDDEIIVIEDLSMSDIPDIPPENFLEYEIDVKEFDYDTAEASLVDLQQLEEERIAEELNPTTSYNPEPSLEETLVSSVPRKLELAEEDNLGDLPTTIYDSYKPTHLEETVSKTSFKKTLVAVAARAAFFLGVIGIGTGLLANYTPEDNSSVEYHGEPVAQMVSEARPQNIESNQVKTPLPVKQVKEKKVEQKVEPLVISPKRGISLRKVEVPVYQDYQSTTIRGGDTILGKWRNDDVGLTWPQYLKAFIEANPNVNPDKINPGQNLQLPSM
jgi:hypothetical protein